jgi:hypothetical protein
LDDQKQQNEEIEKVLLAFRDEHPQFNVIISMLVGWD